MQLVKDTVNLVPGTWPLGTLAETDKTDDIRKSDSPQLYAKKALKFLSDQELRLALQLFAILNSPQNSGRNKIAHLRPSTTHAAKCITLLSAAMAGFETACALQIVSENEPFLDHTILFGQVEADEGMQHTLANRVEGARRLKHSREGVGAGGRKNEQETRASEEHELEADTVF
ncbi:hypothetical protein BT96DRAFT_509296 [Gymnopus androsaceus JB14]|uniref:Uncharacterized protein n=1 Tax=Gymnopus androsaceus JB14 TaxID=1447944 RepID=A0A6A4GMH2_9AGAR|nr:hypothetical protein BT96DRAFT_509296 [Gymnopus androsaceus JB14]